MSTDYDRRVQAIVQTATTEPRGTLVRALQTQIDASQDALTPVLAVGALCYDRANQDAKMAAADLAALREWLAVARRRSAGQGTPEASLAEAADLAFSLVVREGGGEEIPAGEKRRAVVAARVLTDAAARASAQPVFDILNAAFHRFFPIKLRDRKGRAEDAARLSRHAGLATPSGTLARFLLAQHHIRRGESKSLGPVAARLRKDVPAAKCVGEMAAMARQGAAAVPA